MPRPSCSLPPNRRSLVQSDGIYRTPGTLNSGGAPGFFPLLLPPEAAGGAGPGIRTSPRHNSRGRRISLSLYIQIPSRARAIFSASLSLSAPLFFLIARYFTPGRTVVFHRAGVYIAEARERRESVEGCGEKVRGSGGKFSRFEKCGRAGLARYSGWVFGVLGRILE